MAALITEIERFNAIKANDEQVLKSLYLENYSKVEQYIVNNSGSPEEAKDIYQEAFIAVWRNIRLDKFYPSNNTALSGYLFQIAKNKWNDHLRSYHHRKIVPMNDSDNEIDHVEEVTPEDEDFLKTVKSKFKELGENCREVLNRFYYQKQSMSNIAQAFDWTEATARNNKYRCIQRLKDLINKRN